MKNMKIKNVKKGRNNVFKTKHSPATIDSFKIISGRFYHQYVQSVQEALSNFYHTVCLSNIYTYMVKVQAHMSGMCR